MLHKFIYRSYKVKGDPESGRKKLTTVLLEKGVVKIDDVHTSSIFLYPSLVFSSKKSWRVFRTLQYLIKHGNDG